MSEWWTRPNVSDRKALLIAYREIVRELFIHHDVDPELLSEIIASTIAGMNAEELMLAS